MGALAVSALIDELKSPEIKIQHEVIQALGRIGRGSAPAVASLIQITVSGPDELRKAASGALIEIALNSTGVLSALVQMLIGPDDKEREVAEALLVALGEPAVPKLISRLYATDFEAPVAVRATLARIGQPAVLLAASVSPALSAERGSALFEPNHPLKRRRATETFPVDGLLDSNGPDGDAQQLHQENLLLRAENERLRRESKNRVAALQREIQYLSQELRQVQQSSERYPA